MKEENSRSTGFFVMALMFGLFSAVFFIMCRPGAGIVWMICAIAETSVAVIMRKKRDREQNNKGDKTDGDRDRCEKP